MPNTEQWVKISWYCGYYVGPYKWRWSGDWVLEPDECCHEFTTEDTLENWNDKCCSATCPKCGGELTQEYDDPQLVEVINA